MMGELLIRSLDRRVTSAVRNEAVRLAWIPPLSILASCWSPPRRKTAHAANSTTGWACFAPHACIPIRSGRRRSAGWRLRCHRGRSVCASSTAITEWVTCCSTPTAGSPRCSTGRWRTGAIRSRISPGRWIPGKASTSPSSRVASRHMVAPSPPGRRRAGWRSILRHFAGGRSSPPSRRSRSGRSAPASTTRARPSGRCWLGLAGCSPSASSGSSPTISRRTPRGGYSSFDHDRTRIGRGAVAKVVEIGWWRSLWLVQRAISGVRAPWRPRVWTALLM